MRNAKRNGCMCDLTKKKKKKKLERSGRTRKLGERIEKK